MREIQLRPWQIEAMDKALKYYKSSNKHFIINAAPGCGKTICASVIAKELIDSLTVERVIVIAPRSEVVRQWSDEFEFVTGRPMLKVTGSDLDIDGYGLDLCATWSAVQNLKDGFHKVCSSSSTLIICDEHHHAAVKAAWGDGADSAFLNAKHVLVLTGTPIRSDGKETIWMAYDSNGQINHPQEGTYTLSYGQAVEYGYCRPATFHRHEGNFTVSLEGEKIASVNGSNCETDLINKNKISGLKEALDFYRLACTRQFIDDKKTPDVNAYQGTMLKWGINKLNQVRLEMPSAGGLVIAHNIEMAQYMCDILEILEGEKPTLIHSQVTNPEQKIDAFRRTNKRWLVSVAMVSEGVDIKRLRVLVYLPNAQTELFFRQAIGRVVRSFGKNDNTSAYVVMPKIPQFEKFALNIEKEMPPKKINDIQRPQKKVCPICDTDCSINAQQCDECGHEFFDINDQMQPCFNCGHLNPLNNEDCDNCGSQLLPSYKIELNEALRDGAIVRGMEIDENEVQHGENISDTLQKDILSSGDEVLIKILNKMPKESLGRLVRMVDKSNLNPK